LKKRQTGRVGAVEAEFFNGLLGVVLGWQGGPCVYDWKPRLRLGGRQPAAEAEELPPLPWDFAWCPLSSTGATAFRRWLQVS